MFSRISGRERPFTKTLCLGIVSRRRFVGLTHP
jgi:hypothetical protein